MQISKCLLIAVTSVGMVALTSCTSAPANYLTAAGDSCQAQRTELQAVDEYFSRELIMGTGIGAATGALTGAMAGYMATHDAKGLVIGATGGMLVGGAGGYFAARAQASQNRDALVQTVYDDVSKENVQVNRATAAFLALKDCRLAAATTIKQSYRQGTLTEAQAREQLGRERGFFAEDIAYAKRIGGQMQQRSTEFVNAATELNTDQDQTVASLDRPGSATAGPATNSTKGTKTSTPATKKTTKKPTTPAPKVASGPPPKTPGGVKTLAQSSQDSVQTYNKSVELAQADADASFDVPTA